MVRKIIYYLSIICLFYFSISCERSHDVIKYKEVPVVINKFDTITVYIERDPRIEDIFIDSLRARLGTREKTGNNDGFIVEEILKSCGINIPAPWCACFLHDGLQRIGLEGGPQTHPGLSSQWFIEEDRITWVRDRDNINTTFEKGWIGGIYFRSKGRIAHVFAVIEDLQDGYIITIEGNTNSAGSREGNGVFIRIRNKNEVYMTSDWLNNN